MWFLKNIKSAEYTELDERLRQLNTRIASLEIDLQLYVKKLRASKGLKDLEHEERQTPQDLLDSVLLPENGSHFSKKSSRN